MVSEIVMAKLKIEIQLKIRLNMLLVRKYVLRQRFMVFLDCVTLNSLRDRVQNFEDFKNRLYNDTSKFLFEKYPHYVTKKYVKKERFSQKKFPKNSKNEQFWRKKSKLTTFLDYALQLIRQNNRRNNPNPPNENENRQHRFKLADLFDENFFDNMKPEAKQRCVERLFEAMFVS